MKFILSIFCSATLLASTAFAGPHPDCADKAVQVAVLKNYNKFHTSTNSCGIKTLTASAQLESFIVCTTDEVDPMEYIVTILPNHQNRKTKEIEECYVSYIHVATDSDAPNFNADKGLLTSANECRISASDRKLVCK